MLLSTFYERETEVQRDKEIGLEFSEKFQSLDMNSRSESKSLRCTASVILFYKNEFSEKKIFSDEASHSLFSNYY